MEWLHRELDILTVIVFFAIFPGLLWFFIIRPVNLISSKMEESIGKNGVTELMWAAWKGDVALAKSLIAKGVEINATDNEGRAALMYSCDRGDIPEIVVALIEEGADINLKSNKQLNAYDIATEKGHKQQIFVMEGKKIPISNSYNFFNLIIVVFSFSLGGLTIWYNFFYQTEAVSLVLLIFSIGALWLGYNLLMELPEHTRDGRKRKAKELGIKTDFIRDY